MEDSHQAVLRMLKADQRSYAVLESLTGIPRTTLHSIVSKQSKSPRYTTIRRLCAFYGIGEAREAA